MLTGKMVVLGVTGGIAAYKAAPLASKLTQAGASVRVIMTDSATKLIAPLTFQTLTRNPVAIDTFSEHDASVVQHIDIADAADLFVIAPATANIIGKMAQGIADDMLSTTYLATTAPVLVAPAMNVHMYEHPAVQHNMAILKSRGVRFHEPGEGQLACGYVGKGRMAEPEQIFETIVSMLKGGGKPLAGKRVLVTAGGTVERIDPVRYITNDSSGKMGFAFAEAARDLGAEVTVVCAKVEVGVPSGVKVIRVESTEEMLDAVLAEFDKADLVVKAAAVADYRPAVRASSKIKKKDDQLTLELVKNPDILATLGARKKHQFLIGFAAETDHVREHALDKLQRKNCDMIVANDVTEPGAGFGTDTNRVTVLGAGGEAWELPLANKREVAERIIALVLEQWRADEGGGKP